MYEKPFLPFDKYHIADAGLGSRVQQRAKLPKFCPQGPLLQWRERNSK
jgi:hypothetical protein